jgi:predicted  nucleic acid-binding Zn-ribbon protein
MAKETLETYKARNDRALEEIKKARDEIAKLQKELKAGKLEIQKLDLRLEAVHQHMGDIADRIPPFGGGG